MLVQFVLLTWILIICKSLEGPKRSICTYGNGTEYCCYGFGEESGRCVECHVGYESRDGRRCVPCQPRMYGKHCVKECMCKVNERCDSVAGSCYESTDVSTLNHISSSTNEFFGSSDTTESKITDGMKNNDQDDETNSFNDLGLSNKGVVVYSTTVAGVIVLLCGIYHLNKCRKRMLRISNKQQIVPRNNGTLAMEDGLYDLIDESNMNENTVSTNDANVNEYLDVVDRFSNSENSSNLEEKHDSENYLKPYPSLPEKVHVHVYENRDNSDSSCSSMKSRDIESIKNYQSYLNAYESLTSSQRLICHTYEEPVRRNATQWITITSRSFSSRSLNKIHSKMMKNSSRRFSF